MSDVQSHLDRLRIRSLILQAIRDYFTAKDYLEVETPVRCPSVIPEAHIDPIRSEGYFLQASPELCMKRLLSKGFDKIFQICKCFRKEERGPRHLTELTMLEWYTKDQTYLDLMNQCHELINFIAARLHLDSPIFYQKKPIHISSSWDRLSVADAFKRYSDMDIRKALKNNFFDEIIGFVIEPELEKYPGPVFLYDYPASQASLSKLVPGTQDYAQRFELYISGIELANGYTELTDPAEQRLRFEKENQIRISIGKTAIPIPENFLNSLKTMPDAAGIALGIDRLVMIFCNAKTIDEVISFSPEHL